MFKIHCIFFFNKKRKIILCHYQIVHTSSVCRKYPQKFLENKQQVFKSPFKDGVLDGCRRLWWTCKKASLRISFILLCHGCQWAPMYTKSVPQVYQDSLPFQQPRFKISSLVAAQILFKISMSSLWIRTHFGQTGFCDPAEYLPQEMWWK